MPLLESERPEHSTKMIRASRPLQSPTPNKQAYISTTLKHQRETEAIQSKTSPPGKRQTVLLERANGHRITQHSFCPHEVWAAENRLGEGL
mmetsp:Transcript_9428/g.14844  ORF Transcript_9428/g.14844 Transcript_9428/m.14844 type:complete len:91 (+) Transcript_9428:143-415(+)